MSHSNYIGSNSGIYRQELITSKFNLPTVDELAYLPLWAIVALAAKYARYAQGVFNDSAPGGVLDNSEIIERAISFTELSACKAQLQKDGKNIVFEASAVDCDSFAASANMPRKVVVSAATAALSTQNNKRKVAGCVNSALESSIEVVLANTTEYNRRNKKTDYYKIKASEKLATNIRQDFSLIKKISLYEGWNDNTPVSQRIFSPDSEIERQVIFAINDLCVKLCQLIAKDGKVLNNIEWRLLEKTIATALDGIGFQVELTPGAKDGGKDIIARCYINGEFQTYYIEIKHWRSKKRVGLGKIMEFVEVNLFDNTSGGLFLSSSGYSQNIYSHLSEISQHRIRLGGQTKIISLCQKFIQEKGQAIWKTENILPSIIYEKTL